MNLKNALKELEVPQDEAVYIHCYGKDDLTEDPVPVTDISKALLKKEVMVVQPNHGGQKHGYRNYMFVLK